MITLKQDLKRKYRKCIINKAAFVNIFLAYFSQSILLVCFCQKFSHNHEKEYDFNVVHVLLNFSIGTFKCAHLCVNNGGNYGK